MGNSIVEAFVSTTEGTTQIKNKGKTWVTADSAETLLWKTRKSGGMFKPYSVIEDSSGAQVATIITAKKGMASCTNYIFKSEPTFDGQSPMTDEEMKNRRQPCSLPIRSNQMYTHTDDCQMHLRHCDRARRRRRSPLVRG